jgi:hypothetical protein
MKGGILLQPSTSTFTSSRGKETFTTLSVVSGLPPVRLPIRSASSGFGGGTAGVAAVEVAAAAAAGAALVDTDGAATGATATGAAAGGAAAGGPAHAAARSSGIT